MKKQIGFITLIALLILPIASACAAKTVESRFHVTCGDVITYDEKKVNFVYPSIVGDKVYLFLPAAWDASKLTYHAAKGTSFYRNGAKLVSGAQTNIFVPDTKVDLYNNKGKCVLTVHVMQGQNIPAVFIINQTGTLTRISKSKEIEETGALAMITADGAVTTDRLTQLRTRGNSTLGYPKKPLQFKLDKKADLLGSGKSKTYILLADYLDHTLLRNRITYDLAAYMGLKYPIACQSVDLYCNGKYAGVYLLTEKVQIGSARIDIEDLEEATLDVNGGNISKAKRFESVLKGISIKGFRIANDPADITGGYILELEKSHRYINMENNGFITQKGQSVVVKEPTMASKAQISYIASIFNSFHNAICAASGIDKETGKHYSEIVDVDSVAVKFLIEEMTKNPDANASSQYFYKDSDKVDSLIYAGPAWDYDIAYGSSKLKNRKAAVAFLTEGDDSRYIYGSLYKHEAFQQRVSEIYFERMLPAVRIILGLNKAPEDAALQSLDAYKREIEASAKMNFTLWRVKTDTIYPEAMENFDSAIVYLKNFITKRSAFLVKEFTR